MKKLFNNLFRKILACALMAMVSMPTSAFSASDFSLSVAEDIKRRGVWLDCSKKLHKKYQSKIYKNPKVIVVMRNSAAQCELLRGNTALAKEMLKKSVKDGSISAKYLLIEIQFSEEQSINEQEFMNLLKIIKTPMKEGGEIIGINWPLEKYPGDTTYLNQELANKITVGLMQLLTKFRIEFQKLTPGQKKDARTMTYWNIVDEIGGESGCKKILELVSTRTQELTYARNNYLRKGIAAYTNAANLIKSKECPNHYHDYPDGLGFRYSK